MECWGDEGEGDCVSEGREVFCFCWDMVEMVHASRRIRIGW